MPPFDRIPREPPPVAPLPETSSGTERPLWSVMIPAYNCAAYLPETLGCILNQDRGAGNMQIEVCDDASTDADVEAIVRDLGKGRVSYFRQPFNVGSLRNYETCLNRSRGRLIHLLHGDDKVLEGFYEKMEQLFSQYSDIGAAFCRHISIDEYNGEVIMSNLEIPEPGILDNWLDKLARKQRMQTPSVVVKREVYEKLGGYYGVHYGDDLEMWMRIAAHYKIGYLPEVLAEYRKHADSITGQYFLTGENIRDIEQVLGVARQYFSEEEWASVYKDARKFYAHYAINTARILWGRYQHRNGTKIQIGKAFNLYLDQQIVYQAAKLYAKMLLGIKK